MTLEYVYLFFSNRFYCHIQKSSIQLNVESSTFLWCIIGMGREEETRCTCVRILIAWYSSESICFYGIIEPIQRCIHSFPYPILYQFDSIKCMFWLQNTIVIIILLSPVYGIAHWWLSFKTIMVGLTEWGILEVHKTQNSIECMH